jgi:hypothetical protein
MSGRKTGLEGRNWRRGVRAGSDSLILAATALICAFALGCGGAPAQKVFATPEDAVKAVVDAVKTGNQEEFRAIFGPDTEEALSSGDPVADRQNREVIAAAMQQGWRLLDLTDDAKQLVIGNEDWPFPIPIVKESAGWRFDTMAGKEEILARRIGRNELAVIQACRSYVQAQQVYASQGHDGQPAGAYAQRIASSPGSRDGLYWAAQRDEPLSPLGEFIAEASAEGYAKDTGGQPQPFHGYFFRILTVQGPSAAGGAKSYIVGGRMTGGFALVAWPVQYAGTGVMTFIVNQDGTLYEKDLGPETEAAVKAMTAYDPGEGWKGVG